jgi:hypothetical protein
MAEPITSALAQRTRFSILNKKCYKFHTSDIGCFWVNFRMLGGWFGRITFTNLALQTTMRIRNDRQMRSG